MRSITIFILMMFAASAFAQLVQKDSIQFSGVVFDENRKSMSNAHILINSTKGTLTSPSGFFNISVNANDTVTFSYVGYKNYDFVVPDTMKQARYVTGVFLSSDTLTLSEVVVLPWLSKEHFRQAFIDQQHIGKDVANARANMSLVSVSSMNQYDYMNTSGIELQMAQFNNAQQYKGLVSPDDMVGMSLASAVALIYRMATYKKYEEKREEDIKKRILRYKTILEQASDSE
ncbi:MAG: carboxypeptidase-like regulatory domain-containing protein [Salinivirgaceae bacterium]